MLSSELLKSGAVAATARAVVCARTSALDTRVMRTAVSTIPFRLLLAIDISLYSGTRGWCWLLNHERARPGVPPANAKADLKVGLYERTSLTIS